jgi:hypothetical protein
MTGIHPAIRRGYRGDTDPADSKHEDQSERSPASAAMESTVAAILYSGARLAIAGVTLLSGRIYRHEAASAEIERVGGKVSRVPGGPRDTPKGAVGAAGRASGLPAALTPFFS